MNSDAFESLEVYSVGTLNYSYTMISPYEFHEQEKVDENLFQFQLDHAFNNIVTHTYPSFTQKNFDWGIAALDLVWKDRYSPLYRIQAGTNSNGTMMNQQQFLNHWNNELQHVKTKIIQNGVRRQIKRDTKLSRQEIIKNLQNQIKMCRQFDLFAYRAFIKVLYGIDDIKKLSVSSQFYLSQRKKHFSKNYLHEKQKRIKTIQLIENRGFDIFCMQQCNKDLINELRQKLQGYVVVEMPDKLTELCQSIILLKKSRFPKYNQQKVQKQREQFLNAFAQFIKNPGNFSKKYSAEKIKFLTQSTEMQDQSRQNDQNDPFMRIHKQICWNDDTCYAIVGPFIIFSPHISTKENLNQQQINYIKRTITRLITHFPEKHFIVAGDLNGQFQNQQNFQTPQKTYIKVNVFPYHNDDVTCYKMRTLTQAQRRKALAVSFCRKDYIISDLKIQDHSVTMFNGAQISKQNAPLIPNSVHPFDHFIVSANLKLTARIQTVSPLRKKKPITTPWEGFNNENIDKRDD